MITKYDTPPKGRLVCNTRYAIPSTWYQVCNTRCAIPGTRYATPGTNQYAIPGTSMQYDADIRPAVLNLASAVAAVPAVTAVLWIVAVGCDSFCAKATEYAVVVQC